jgi:uncharacterized protein (TIGR03083 family)
MSSLVVKATEAMTDALREVADGSWEVSAGDVDWSCRDTAAHVADDLFSYASQVIAQPADGYLPIEAAIDPSASNVEILSAVAMCGRLLANAVESADPGARGWHPYGTSDPDGFAAMGVVEVLVHTFDMAKGLGLDWTPPTALCEPVLRRLFPQAPSGDPAAVLLYCCGREPLDELPRLEEWTWDSSVPGDTSTRR